MPKYQGLNQAEVIQSRHEHGANTLTPPAKAPLWKLFLVKFTDPLIIILLIAGMLSIGISCYEYYMLGEGPRVFFEPVGIFVAILLATGLAFYFEQQADKEFSLLNQVSDDEPVEVIREGNSTTVPKRDVVVGDIVVVNTGAEVPADGELLEATALTMDESSLTGEPQCRKTTDGAQFDSEATFPSNHVLRGTKVLEGHGVFRVHSVGDRTENGRVFVAAQIDDSVRTPLNEQLERLSRLISYLSYSVAALVVVTKIVMLFSTGMASTMHFAHILAYVLQTLMVAVTLIVVSVPEGLPMAVTLSLAYSMRNMLRQQNLVRRMHACETMGAATVILTDKTGTLTENQMRVAETRFYDEARLPFVREGIAVNSTAALDRSAARPLVLGNPTEGALMLWLEEQSLDYEQMRAQAPVEDELPFSTERKFMATVVRSAIHGRRVLYVKGAPEIVLAQCAQVAAETRREDIESQLQAYQQQAMRTLGFACQELADDEHPIHDHQLSASRLCFLGIAAISDPVRPDVPKAIAQCMRAGIKVKVVTGDTPATARAIARRIGLFDEADTARAIITGPELERLSDEELHERIGDLKVIARARPMDKRRLVETLQAQNEVVAVTGDGTNDAPALKAAHVGLSMGDGTAVAKEAGDITIIDNSFTSIGRAVKFGRSLYQNIQRFLLFQLTVNVSACLIVLVGSFMGTESPLTVTQMLWVNLIMDTFGAMALASLPPSDGVMKEKPRDRNANILTRDMQKEILGVGLAFFLMLFSLLYLFHHTDATSLVHLLSLPLSAKDEVTPYEQTLLFSIFVWTHFWYLFNTRAFRTGHSVFRLRMGRGFRIIVGMIVVGQLMITEVGYEFFNCEPFLHNARHPWAWLDLLLIITLSTVVIWIREAWQWIKK